ncbi:MULTISPECIES: hypothetical protein [unclassified Sporosarcina]|uniref:hypothetical protein n=1 Tax=unclassified Sporosarcina TaxID=2647733 RepID=UPI001C4A66AD|nr:MULTISPECIES: hypothetical protein [unclassified Sporosarcina]
MQELTLFDLGMETTEDKKEVAKKEKKETKSKTSTSGKTSSPKKTPAEPKPEIKVTSEWTIHFATEQFLVTDFVEDFPEEGVTLEELRVELEKSFAQFSAARTKWDVDEESKRLFPDAFAGSKGGHSLLRGPFLTSIEEAESHPGNISYVPGQDGHLYEVRKSPFGRMIAKTSYVPQLEQVESGFTFDLPKIPRTILANILSFFKAYTRKGNYEVMIRVYWDQQEELYVVECPMQTVTGTHIDCRYGDEFMGRNSLRYMVVLEIHSHNVMRAFFSSTDDHDEQRYGLYAVVGRLNRPIPEILLRAKSNEHSVIVPASDVFELDINGVQEGYPLDWDEKVTLKGWSL